MAAPLTSVLRRLDPTRPEQWDDVRAGGRLRFLLLYGVLGCGVVAALALDLFVLTRQHDWDIFFSARHVARLELAMLVVAPTIGALCGHALLRIGDRRYRRECLKHAFRPAGEGATSPHGTGLDAEPST